MLSPSHPDTYLSCTFTLKLSLHLNFWENILHLLSPSHPDTYHSCTFALKLSFLYISPKKIQPPSQISLQKSQPPPVPSPANLRLQGPRHHRPAPASTGAAHRRQNQVLFCLFRLGIFFSFRFSSYLTLLWFFLGSMRCFIIIIIIIIYLCVSYGFVSFWLLCSLLVTGFLVFDF